MSTSSLFFDMSYGPKRRKKTEEEKKCEKELEKLWGVQWNKVIKWLCEWPAFEVAERFPREHIEKSNEAMRKLWKARGIIE